MKATPEPRLLEVRNPARDPLRTFTRPGHSLNRKLLPSLCASSRLGVGLTDGRTQGWCDCSRSGEVAASILSEIGRGMARCHRRIAGARCEVASGPRRSHLSLRPGRSVSVIGVDRMDDDHDEMSCDVGVGGGGDGRIS